MFNIGDLIIYSGHGICKIDDICDKTISGIKSTYYVLHPIGNGPQLTISTPVHNNKVTMLELVDHEEANELVKSFNYPGIEWIDNANVRLRNYSDIVNTGDRKEIVKLVNTLMRKKIEAEHQETKLHNRDDELLTTTQNILFNEMAISLKTTFEAINERVVRLLKDNPVS